MRRRCQLFQPAICFILIATGFAISAPTPADTTSNQQAEQLAALDHDDYRQRQAQTRRLLADESLTMDDLAALIAEARSLEQRHRLLAVARHHLLRIRRETLFDQPDRGSLGVSHRVTSAADMAGMSGHGSRPVVEIVRTLPGFPAHAHLQPGDRITAVAGQPLPVDFDSDQFRGVILQYASGDTFEMTVDRDGETLDISIILAPARALPAMYDPAGLGLRPQYERDWRQARDRLIDADAESSPLQLPTIEEEAEAAEAE